MNILVKEKFQFVLKEGEHLASFLKVSKKLNSIGFVSEIPKRRALFMNILVRDTAKEGEKGWYRIRRNLTKLGVQSISDFALDIANNVWIVDLDGKLLHITDGLRTARTVTNYCPYFRMDFSFETGELILANREGLAGFGDNGNVKKIVTFDKRIGEIFSVNGFCNFTMANGGIFYLSTSETFCLIKASESGRLEKVISEPRLQSNTKFVKFTSSHIHRICIVDEGRFLLLPVSSERGQAEYGGFYLELVDADLRRIEKLDAPHKSLLATDGKRMIYFIEIEPEILHEMPFLDLAVCEAELIL